MRPTNFYIYLYQFKKKNEYLDGEVMKSILEISERTYRYSEKTLKQFQPQIVQIKNPSLG